MSEIIERLKACKGYESDADLARELGVHPKKLGVWKSRNTVPLEELTTFCRRNVYSLEWALTGDGLEPEKTALPPRTAALLDNYEALNEEDKRAFERLAFTVAQSQKITKKAG